MIPIVIDTDTAADDCFALLVGLLDPRADLRAVTIVGGNVGFDQQVHNALLTMSLAGRSVPVHLGARDPLEREWVSAEDVHGDGVGGQRFEGELVTEEEHAVDALIRLAAEQPGTLRVVCIGPLTNIALAIEKDPAFVSNVAGLWIMGGSINGRGNITPAAEYNIYVDPEAAAIVFAAGFAEVTVVSWDPVTIRDTVVTQERLDRIAALDTPLSRFFVRANTATFAFDHENGLGGSTHPDSLTTLLAIDPSYALETASYRVEVETQGELTRGATVFDWRSAEPNAVAVERADEARFIDYLTRLLAQ